MVRSGQDRAGAIAEIGYSAPAGTPAGIEVLQLSELRSRVDARALAAPQRPTFHHLVTVRSGALRHTVDFTDHVLRPGAWLWIRPGQVHQWHDLQQAEGTLVLFQPDFLDVGTSTATSAEERGPLYTPEGAQLAVLELAAEHLQREFDLQAGSSGDVHVAVLRHLLAALLLRLAHLPGPDGAATAQHPGVFAQYRAAVERGFLRRRRVEDYARDLGYSPRTLSRASLAATGVGAKELLDRRVVLEAKRLLAHTDRTAAQVGAQLGFSSATNFSKFFHQRTGTTPLAFRAQVRGEAPVGSRGVRPEHG